MSQRYIVQGEGEITLGQGDFVAQGGEGSVYRRGSTAYKLYIDPGRMIPVGKITELAAIKDADVIRPDKVILDRRSQKPVGYTMRFVKDTYTLCELFPRAFRDRNGITPDMSLELVRNLQARLQAIHDAGVLVVDLNEMNELVGPDFTTAYYIDADSYQTPGYRATALMESVRDRHAKPNTFSQETDWFALAVVTFQAFVGIHPYKGRHGSLKGLDARMLANASVLGSGVRVPKAVLPFDVIPDVYRSWYEAVFEQGKRVAPPDGLRAVITVVPQVRNITGTGNLIIQIVQDLGQVQIASFFEGPGGRRITATSDGVFVDQVQKYDTPAVPYAVGFSNRMGKGVMAYAEYGRLKLRDLTTGEMIPLDMVTHDIMGIDGRIYVRNRTKIIELVLSDIGQKVVASTRSAGRVLENATRMFPGVVLQSMLGATYASMYPRSKACYQTRLAEIDGYSVLDARFDGGVLMVVGADKKTGQTDRLVFRFDPTYQTYDLRKVEDITPTGLNFVVLENGICACLNEDENLVLFSAKKGSKGMKVIEDDVLGGDMTLVKLRGKVGFTRGGTLYSLTMK